MSNEYREPPDLSGKEIDFSYAHFLDHTIWQCGRRGEYEYGGRRQHLLLRWQYQWRPAIRRNLHCRVGLHKRTQYWRGNPPRITWIGCCHCHKRFSEPQPV